MAIVEIAIGQPLDLSILELSSVQAKYIWGLSKTI
jgi:hypothetical protein